ncbi:MAG TPA: SDR family NAD(P)-dependent oxidoreductase [Pyrinomonadaceae bacterium]|jgi:3-oxoacyl-[acyl-carrier protein] reductase|nr:SDR family NAD(P)-dependent oxidoreductase [Pyrinomonadaceae bacterium]
MIASPDWGQNGRVVLITGATGYLGRALAHGFSEAGATLFLTARNQETLGALAAELSTPEERVHTLALDLTDSAAGEHLVSAALLKGGRIDTLVLNAGTLADGLVAGLTDYELEQVYELNLWGTFRALRAALRPMILQRSGQIVVISSTAAQRPGVGQGAYASSKAALEALVRTTARETAARGIRINGVAPGLLSGGMATRILDEAQERAVAAIPMRRPGAASEVVPVVLFLASPMSAYVTGQVWSIDGGYTA